MKINTQNSNLVHFCHPPTFLSSCPPARLLPAYPAVRLPCCAPACLPSCNENHCFNKNCNENIYLEFQILSILVIIRTTFSPALLPACLPDLLPACPPVCLSTCPTACLRVCPPGHLDTCPHSCCVYDFSFFLDKCCASKSLTKTTTTYLF